MYSYGNTEINCCCCCCCWKHPKDLALYKLVERYKMNKNNVIIISTKAVGVEGQNGGNSPISSFVMSAAFSQAWMYKNPH